MQQRAAHALPACVKQCPAGALKYAMDTETLWLGKYYEANLPSYDEGFEAKRQAANDPNYRIEKLMQKYKR